MSAGSLRPVSSICHPLPSGSATCSCSGVAVFSRTKPDAIVTGYGSREFDTEGRYIEAQFKNLSVVSVYLPSGSSSEERQQAKFRCLGEFMPYLRSLQRRRRD